MVSLLSANDVPYLVDDEDLDLVSLYTWRAYKLSVKSEIRYVMAEKDGVRVYLHRLLTGAAKGMDVDHINGDGLDNRRENLRVCEHKFNLANQRPQVGRSSVYKGVSLVKKTGRWESYIKTDRRKQSLGQYKDEVEAARAYDAAALAAWGSYAYLNFPETAALVVTHDR